MKFKILAVLVPLALTGCAPGMVGPISQSVEKEHSDVARMMNNGRLEQTSIRSTPAVERVSGLWLPSKKIPVYEGGETQNKTLSRTIAINRAFNNLQELAERITTLTGVPVVISPEAAMPVSGTQGAQPGVGMAPGPAMQNPVPMLPPGVPGMPGIPGSSLPGAMPGMYGQPINMAYNGKLSGFLDVAAARYGVFWEWDSDKIRFFRTTTKTFRLSALPGDTTLTANISNQSNGTGSSGSQTSGTTSGTSSQTAGVSFSGLSVWQSINDAIKTMLTTAGKVTVSAATGTVTVTDTPQVIYMVGKFIEQQNIALGRQVVVNVKVLSVDLTDSDNYGINWNAVYKNLSDNFGWTLNNAFAADANASQLALKILGTAGAATNSNIKSWAGTEALIQALSKQGRVSQVTSASVTTLNNQPAPIQVGKQTSYLASSSTTPSTTAGVAPTTALTPGLINTGFSMNLVPHMLDGGRLLLQYAVDLSTLTNLATVTSGGSSIQTPEIETRNFLQRVMLNSGDTLVVSGFEQSSQSGDMQGIGSPKNTLLGGGVKGSKEKTVLVILIQPVIAD
jgi:type IVB pilus formation R64 PilN family outer membrane protein